MVRNGRNVTPAVIDRVARITSSKSTYDCVLIDLCTT